MCNAENNNANASEQVMESRKTVFQLGTLANVALTSGNIEAWFLTENSQYIIQMCQIK